MDQIIDTFRRGIRDIWRHRWLGLGVAWLVILAGTAVVYSLPNQYEATARVYVDTQSILKPLMQGLTVTPNTEQQVAMMSHTLLSRPNLEKVIGMSDLNLRVNSGPQNDAMVDALGRRIEMKSTGGIDLYTISFRDPNPALAKKVVSSLLSIFVESNIGDKRADSDSAKVFLDEQIKSYEQKLNAADNALKDFKIKNMGLMPNEGQDYFSEMTAAQAQLNQAQLALAEAERARDAVRSQLAGKEPVLLDDDSDVAEGGKLPEIDVRIQTLKKQLDDLRMRYTEEYPDIVSTKRVIAQLEQQKKEERKAAIAAGNGGQALGTNPVYQQLQIQEAHADAEVASLQARVSTYSAQVARLRANAQAVPAVEAQFQQLTRDYETTKSNYDKLVQRRESAQMSSDMDASAGMVQFRVVDPPRVSPNPVAPNRLLLLTLIFAASIACGIASALLMSQARPTVADRKHLRTLTGLPVLGTVTMMWTDAQRRRAQRHITGFALGVAGLFCLYAFGLTYFLVNTVQPG